MRSSVSTGRRGRIAGWPFGTRVIKEKSGDQTAEFNDYLSEVSDQGGGTVFVGPGTFTAKGIEMPDNTALVGSGRGSTKIETPDTSGKSVIIKNKDQSNGNKNLYLSDLTVDAKRTSGASGENGNIDFAYVKNVSVERVTSLDPYSHAMEFQHAVNCEIRKYIGERTSDYNADDCLSISDKRQITEAPRTEDVQVYGSKAIHPPGSLISGSGFEVDDGPNNIDFYSCSTYNCDNGYVCHGHNGTFDGAHDISYYGCDAFNTRRGFQVYNRDGDEDIRNIFFFDCYANASVEGFNIYVHPDAVDTVTRNVRIANSRVEGDIGITNEVDIFAAYNNDLSDCITSINNQSGASTVDIRDNRV